jgi:hypothetical protein
LFDVGKLVELLDQSRSDVARTAGDENSHDELLGVKTALSLGAAFPSSTAVGVGPFAGAGNAADADESLGLERMLGQFVVVDVEIDIAPGPVEHRVVPENFTGIGFDAFFRSADGALVPSHAADPDIAWANEVLDGLDFVDLAAAVNVFCEEKMPARGALIVVGALGADLGQIQAPLLSQLHRKGIRLRKEKSSVNQNHRHFWRHLTQHVQQRETLRLKR